MIEKIFDMESPWMRFLEKLGDLIWINLLTLLCCLPVVTAGAALAAMHHMCLRMVRNEEGNLTKGYFRALRFQLTKATPLWLLFLLVWGILLGDYYIIAHLESGIPILVKCFLWILTGVLLCTSQFLFPMQARFTNSLLWTVRNAFMASLLKFPKTLLMIGCSALPVLVCLVSYKAAPILLFWGVSGPAYLKALTYDSFFKRIEIHILESKKDI